MKNEENHRLDLTELLKKLRAKNENGGLRNEADVEQALAGSLSEGQTQTLREVLADREKTRKLLESERAKELFAQFLGNGHE